MRFALNYSPEAVRLWDAGEIDIDLFKLPDWEDFVDDIRQQYPVYVHFGIMVGSPAQEPINWHMVERFLAQTESHHVNVHLGVRHAQVLPSADILDCCDAMADNVSELMRRDLEPIVRRFGAERVIAENLFTLDKHGIVMQACSLPHVIRRVVEDAGCGLLLDTAHAQIAAFTFGMSTQDYISALPVNRLRELHVTGVGYREDGRLGDHLPMRAIDWAVYEWALEQIHNNAGWSEPHIVACEYGGVGEPFRPFSEESVIAEQVPRMVRAVQPQRTAQAPS